VSASHLSEKQLRDMHQLKTGALLQGSVLMGAACGPTSAQQWQALQVYGAAIGLAFQVVDDILDVTADSATLGKTAGKDAWRTSRPTCRCWAWSARRRTRRSCWPTHARGSCARCPTPRVLRALANMVVDRIPLKPWRQTPMPSVSYPLLHTINRPGRPAPLPRGQLATLASELRAFLLASVAKTGGHLSSNLGTVELTVALHYVFNTPHDRLVWDVGHQTYPHKILTGRRERMASLRQLGGLSGFPQRTESEYDAFRHRPLQHLDLGRAGHGAGGRIKGEDRHSVAIIGDGALTAGMAFEALEQRGRGRLQSAGDPERQRHEHQPAGGRAEPLSGAADDRPVLCGCQERRQVGSQGCAAAVRAGQALRGTCQGHGGAGHLVREVRFQLHRPDRRPRPRVPGADAGEHPPPERPAVPACGHAQGQGYKLAEADPVAYHGPGKFDPAVGLQKPSTALPSRPSPRCLASGCATWPSSDPRLVGITPAMREGSGLVEFEKRFPTAVFRRRHRRATCGHLSPPAWPARASSRWWRSIPPSCSAPTTS
jgi:hypothetical protein